MRIGVMMRFLIGYLSSTVFTKYYKNKIYMHVHIKFMDLSMARSNSKLHQIMLEWNYIRTFKNNITTI